MHEKKGKMLAGTKERLAENDGSLKQLESGPKIVNSLPQTESSLVDNSELNSL